MDKNVTLTHAAQTDPVNGVAREGNQPPRRKTVVYQYEPQAEVSNQAVKSK